MRSAFRVFAWAVVGALVSHEARAQSNAPPTSNATSTPTPTSTSTSTSTSTPTPTSTSTPTPTPPLVAPHLLSDPAVPYPTGASGDATVLLTLVIEDDGTVRTVTAESPDEPFSSRATDAASAWRFTPATRDGKPVSARIRIEVVFHAPLVEPPAPRVAPVAAPTSPVAKPDPDALEVRVRGERVEPSRSVSLSRTEVRQIPGVFGDPFRAIEVMPGVTPIVSGLPFFFVRGAPPGDVGYFLDGVRVPYLFHVGAGPSVIHPALIDQVDLYPGGYPARFGRFSGGIVSGETAAPSGEARGEGNIRIFDAGAFVESPFADGKGDALVAGRYSYTAALLSLLQSSVKLNYWDYQARIGYDLTSRDRISLFVFGASDFLGDKDDEQREQTLFDVTFHRLDLRWDHRLDADGTLRLALTGGIDRSGGGDGDENVRDRMVGARAELEYRLAPIALLRAGADVELDRYDTSLIPAGDVSSDDAAVAAIFPSRTDVTMGTRADVVLGVGPRLEVIPGVRLDAYHSAGASAIGVDPRLATRTVVTNHLRLLGSMGIAHQEPSFVVPVPGFQPGGLHGGLQTAVQESVGLEADLGNATIATATLYHNAFFNLSDAISANQTPASQCPVGSSSQGQSGFNGSGGCTNDGGVLQGPNNTTAQVLETRSNGSAYGMEIFVKRKLTRKLGGFLSYTLSRSVRTANNQRFIAPFDRTHVANAALAYDLGRNWRAGTRVIFYTGLPKAYDPTSSRMEPFFRLDLRLEKRWPLGGRKWLSFVVEWMNATLSKESVGSNCTLNGCEENRIGPVTIPSIGLEGGF